MFAFYSQIDDVGKGGGPALVAGLIMASGRRFAFNVAMTGWLVCGCVLLTLRGFIDADVVRAQEQVENELDGVVAEEGGGWEGASRDDEEEDAENVA